MSDTFISKDEYTELNGISSMNDRDKLDCIEYFINKSIQIYIDDLKGATGVYRAHIVGAISSLEHLNRHFFDKNRDK